MKAYVLVSSTVRGNRMSILGVYESRDTAEMVCEELNNKHLELTPIVYELDKYDTTICDEPNYEDLRESWLAERVDWETTEGMFEKLLDGSFELKEFFVQEFEMQ